MVSPYRTGEPPKAPTCPRCHKTLPPTDVAACPKGCGTWVSQFASTEVLTDVDRKPDPVTRWWRVRAPCPLCGERMTLRGEEPGLLQGCEQHGYFIDTDTIQHTGLARGVNTAALECKRADSARVEAERDALAEAAERERQKKLEIERKEAELDERVPTAKPPTAFDHERIASLIERAAMEPEPRAADARAELLELMTSGADRALARYVLELEDRVRQLEARLRELEDRA